MAQRRMFARDFVRSDAFGGLPHGTQTLYLHLAVEADDDGFLSGPMVIARSIGLSMNELNELRDNGYIILFESGVCLIVHWQTNNQIRSDRYTPTVHIAEKQQVTCENKVYRMLREGETPISVDTQYSVDGGSVGDSSLGEANADEGTRGARQRNKKTKNVLDTLLAKGEEL